ncbi:MAG: T9SS type A sorting domain-containing protein, partial [Novosphingobium sp.]|nr:T9SS type A sorting domain-containing protein [Novosphingobium sp.]
AFEQAAPFRTFSNYVSPSGASLVVNLYVSAVDLPAIEDVDGDGDLDLLTFSLVGSLMEYHKNLSMELYGTCDSLKFELRNKCWGSFVENANNNTVELNAPCSPNVPAPEMGTNDEEIAAAIAKAEAHAGSTVLALDLDGDLDKDLLIGDIAYNNLVGLYNGGTVDLAFMTAVDTDFPSDDQSVDLAIFPGAYYEDVDNDGRRDLICSPSATSLAHNTASMWYYRNVGTDAAPDFEFVQQNLFQDRMLEHGEGAYPVAFDADGDGRMDLLVSNYGYFVPPDQYSGRMAYYRNTGTALAPAFEFVTDDYMGLSSSGIGSSFYPAFSDLDGDGDMDMYIGDLLGRIHFYRNISTGPVAQFQLAQANVVDGTGDAIDVGQFATPLFTDLDEDGLQDLIIGERNGNLNYYRNTGSASAPTWTLITEDLGGVLTVVAPNVTGHSVPALFRNVDGDREMLLGSESGWLYHYGSIEEDPTGTWTLLDSTFMDLREGERTAPCLFDFNGDGKPDMVLGNLRGGLSYWSSDDLLSVGGARDGSGILFSIIPNPATNTVELVLNGPSAPGTWVIRNGLGQELMRTRANSALTRMDVRGLNSGVYFVSWESGGISVPQRLVVVR